MSPERSASLRYDLVVFFCLLLLGGLIYCNNYHVPWYLDDSSNIAGNKAVYAYSGLLQTLALPRGPALLSFALNYAVHGESLPGYHLVNNLIHVFASWLVYLLLKRVAPGNRTLAFLGALIFLAHPIQTQAVTYIVQRMTSLAAFFALGSLYCYVRGREVLSGGEPLGSVRHSAWYAVMIGTMALALLTKQNTAFLPFGLYVFGRYFLDREQGWNWRRNLAYLSPCIVLPLGAVCAKVLLPLMRGTTLADITSTEVTVSPLRYFVSEWGVLVAYLRLLCAPYGQTLDYNLPLVTEYLSLATILSGTLLASLLCLAYRLRDACREASFAIVWFFLALAVESSFIPLDLIFEHRLYLPMFGFAVLLVWLLGLIAWPRVRVGVALLLIGIYSLLTLQRNALWADPVAFTEDNLRKAPHNERLYVELSRRYIESRRYADAEKMLQAGLAINPRSGKLHDNLGSLYDLRGEQAKAIDAYRQGIGLAPLYETLYLNLAVVYTARNELQLAEGLLLKALTIKPGFAMAHFNLGVVYYRMGDRIRALKSFRSALEHAPYNADAMYNLIITAFETGDRDLAQTVLPRLKPLDPVRAAELEHQYATGGK